MQQHQDSEVICNMKQPHARVKFAAVLVFVFLTANFMAGQAINRGHGNNPAGDPVPDDVSHTHNGNPDKTLPAVPGGPAVVTGNGINYHGGPVMQGNPVPIYIIWYGNWASTGSNTAATTSLVEHFIGTLGNTPYELIASTYGDNTG